MAFTVKKAIEFGPGPVTLRLHQATETPGLFVEGTPNDGRLLLLVGSPTVLTQTDSTAQGTLAADTVTSIAAAVPADAGAATATAIAATSAAITDPVATTAGWGAATEAAFDLFVTETTTIATHVAELDLDYEALLVDVADIRTQFNLLTTHSTEIDLDLEALIVDVRDLKSFVNSLVDILQDRGIVG